MKTIVVLGGGESGVSAALLAKKKGFNVFLSDLNGITDIYREELLKADIPFEEGGHFSPLLQEAEMVIKSPGIPQDNVIVASLRERNIPVLSEVAFAASYLDGNIIAITGTNGKTTTTSFIHHIFHTAGRSVALGGNIGVGVGRLALQSQHSFYILEVSSFQLEDIGQFRPNIAIILNITPDHLDRYNSDMQAYADAKWNITTHQTQSDWLILEKNNPYIEQCIVTKPTKAHQTFVETPELIDDRFLQVDGFSYDMKLCQLQGAHNHYNMTCGILAARRAGIDPEAIQCAIDTFKPVSHRLELVGEIDEVSYINDSKATNVEAVWYALKAMKKPVIWIAGGKDKGNDYTMIESLVQEKVHALICLGKDNDKLLNFFTGKVQLIFDTHTMEHALDTARSIARPGDVVLLSPACASFDLFRNYEHRGDLFREGVQSIIAKMALS